MENLNNFETPNFNYFEALNNPELKTKMIALLLTEFTQVRDSLLPLLEEKNTEDMVNSIHKLSSKFSILDMKEAYSLSKKLEDELREGEINEEEITYFHSIIEHIVPFLSE